MKQFIRAALLFSLFFLLFSGNTHAEVQRIYDQAGLLTDEQVQVLEEQAAAYFEEWQTDFIIITTEDTDGKPIMNYMGDFIDELADEWNRPEESMAVLTIDMGDRWVDLAGFGLAKEYLDDSRLDQIRNQITPHLSDNNHYEAFQLFFEKADQYLGVRPGVNPESIFLKTYFQLAVALGLAGIIVFFMAYNSGGRVTVTSGTYLNRSNSAIISKHDRYLRKTVTRRKKPSNNNKGGGGGFGGGGGMTGGGRSHSGSRGRF